MSQHIDAGAVRTARRSPRRRMPYYLLVAVICYVGSYVCLSAYGRFQPALIGAGVGGNSVKAYSWCPAGFHSGYRRRFALYYVYMPLYTADRFYWHRGDQAYDGTYPTATPATAAEWAEWSGKP